MGGQQKKKVKLSSSSRCTRSRRESNLAGAGAGAGASRSSRRKVKTSETAVSESSDAGTEAVPTSTGTLVTGQFLSSLTCQICAEVMTLPVSLCLAGHSTCGKCSSRMERCGFCREPFNSVRNHSVENILSSCSIPCQFQSAGCTGIIKLLDYASHTNSCPYNPNPNPVPPQNNPSTTTTGEGERLMPRLAATNYSQPQVNVIIRRHPQILRNMLRIALDAFRTANSSRYAYLQIDEIDDDDDDDDVGILPNFQFIQPRQDREAPLVVDLVSSDEGDIEEVSASAVAAHVVRRNRGERQ